MHFRPRIGARQSRGFGSGFVRRHSVRRRVSDGIRFRYQQSLGVPARDGERGVGDIHRRGIAESAEFREGDGDAAGAGADIEERRATVIHMHQKIRTLIHRVFRRGCVHCRGIHICVLCACRVDRRCFVNRPDLLRHEVSEHGVHEGLGVGPRAEHVLRHEEVESIEAGGAEDLLEGFSSPAAVNIGLKQRGRSRQCLRVGQHPRDQGFRRVVLVEQVLRRRKLIGRHKKSPRIVARVRHLRGVQFFRRFIEKLTQCGDRHVSPS